ncbi:hypothetical protein [Streptomyces scabiei]|uniref:hypothetical protein n=1 Tax=Streptomyces scabiei TaxID=1930 RepID=UPI001F2CD9E9|nr:hypothetical protein [Streptomyces scabiei]
MLLAAVMALSWWEDRILPTPPAEPAEAPTEAPLTPAAPAQFPEPVRVDTALIQDVAGR